MNDVFLPDGVRTPSGRHGGALSGVRPDDLAAHVLRTPSGRRDLDPEPVDEVVLGDADQAGEDNRDVARMATLPAGIVNVDGGATAPGHPPGASGARVVIQLAADLRRRGGGRGLAALCVGVGQGLAVVLEAQEES